jgi:nicotinamide mononucleotide adenylyltransferase
MHKQYSLFIGRWQPWHEGHRWLIDERLKLGKNVCVAIRDIAVAPHQPWTAEQVQDMIELELRDLILAGQVKVIIIPDIESVNYGRSVGYDVIEHFPPQNIADISATKIRQNLYSH